MSKSKNKKKTKQSTRTSGKIVSSSIEFSKKDMSSDDLQETIVNSLLVYDQKKAEMAKQAEEDELQTRREAIGYKDYSNRKLIPRIIMIFLNRLKVFIRVLFMPKEKIRGEYMTTSLMSTAVSSLFGLIKWMLWIIAAVLLLRYPLSFVVPSIPTIKMSLYLVYIGISILAFVFAQVFRIVSIEMEKMQDRNYVVDIFAAVTAIVSIIISLVIR